MFRQKVAQYIQKKQLFQETDKLLVALSGGADSVALLRVLLELGYSCEAAHCNFHLRGEESDRDERFVRDLCNNLNITLHVVHFQTEKIASEKHISIEMAARELRYEWFEKRRLETGADYICVAHHQGDSVETFLLNLLRGAGIQGLRGIQSKNGNIVRPLLEMTREEITDYLQHLSQDYITDSTNLQTEYLRNKVCLELLPLMQTINPAANERIAQTANYLNDAYLYYERGIQEGKERVLTSEGISIAALKREPSPACLLHEILSPLGFNSAQEAEILQSIEAQSGKTFMAEKYQVVKDRDMLLISRLEAPAEPRLTYEKKLRTPEFVIPKDKHIACLDADKITAPLTLRLVQTGDAFIPYGMKGRKLVSDYLTDRKYSLLRKQRQWVLCSVDEIVWLVGERIDHRYRVTEQTSNLLLIHLLP